MAFTKLLVNVKSGHRVFFSKFARSCSTNPDKESPNKCSGNEDNNLDSGKKGYVLGVYKTNNKLELTPTAAEIDQLSEGRISRHLNELSCRMELGKAFVVSDVTPQHACVALACLGPKEPGLDDLEALDLTREYIRCGVGAGVRALCAACCGAVAVDGAAAPGAAAEAAHLATWRFEEFKSDKHVQPTLSLLSDNEDDKKLWSRGVVGGVAQNWARHLADMPANRMTPIDLAQAALDVLCPLGVSVQARDRNWIEAQNMQAFLAVSRGSCAEPLFIECSYTGAEPDRPPMLLAAKGITFDSGGLCLKPAAAMSESRGSMAGAAAALAALKAIAEMKVPINVSCVIPACENMVSGQCMKVGDVVTALNGLSIQIEDTDMEGRLALADALVYGQRAHRPALVLDVATLTHGIELAMGGAAFGCFTGSEAAWRALRAAGATTGDRPWRMPLWNYYHRQITDEPSVDLRNRGSGHASPCLGAAFLKNFVCGEWVHLDITGVGKEAPQPPPYLRPRHMTGRPTRTIAVLLENIAAATSDTK